VNDAFVSYAREDREVAEKLVLSLQQSGLTVWWDGLLLGGDDFGKTIDAELRRSKCVVVIWSKNSVKSDWVPNEVRRGRNHNARVVPVRVDDCEEPLEFSGRHIIDLQGLLDDAEHPGLTEVGNSVRGVITPLLPRASRPWWVLRSWPEFLGAAVLGAILYRIVVAPTPTPPPPPPVEEPGPVPTGEPTGTGGTAEVPATSGGTAGASGGRTEATGGRAATPGPQTPPPTCCGGPLGGLKPCSKKTCAECGLRECK